MEENGTAKLRSVQEEGFKLLLHLEDLDYRWDVVDDPGSAQDTSHFRFSTDHLELR